MPDDREVSTLPTSGVAPELSFANLCHPVSCKKPFTAEGRLFELKHDGFRALILKTRGSVELRSRNGLSMTKAFPDVVRALASIDDVVLDAELVIPDSAGRSDFEELRQRSLIRRLPLIQEAAALRPAALIVFDVLQAKGEDRALPLSERKAWLAANVTPRPGLQVIEGHEKHGEAMFESIIAQDFEGLVAKRLDAPYKAGRRPTWLKIKNREYSRREAVEFWR